MGGECSWGEWRRVATPDRARMVCVYDGGGRGNLRIAKTPPLQSALAGRLAL